MTPNEAAMPTGRSQDMAIGAGILLGLLIPSFIALLGGVDSSLETLEAIGLIGIPAGMGLGAWYGAHVRPATSLGAARIVLAMGALASFAPALLIGGLLAIVATLAAGLGGVAVVPIALMFAIPVLVITLPCALAWALVMRLLPERLVGDGLHPISSWWAVGGSLLLLVSLAVGLLTVPIALR